MPITGSRLLYKNCSPTNCTNHQLQLDRELHKLHFTVKCWTRSSRIKGSFLKDWRLFFFPTYFQTEHRKQYSILYNNHSYQQFSTITLLKFCSQLSTIEKRVGFTLWLLFKSSRILSLCWDSRYTIIFAKFALFIILSGMSCEFDWILSISRTFSYWFVVWMSTLTNYVSFKVRSRKNYLKYRMWIRS